VVRISCRDTWSSTKGNPPMRMQSLSESGRVASCLPIGTTSSKTKCVRSRNGRSLLHPKQISTTAIVGGTRRTIVVTVCAVIAIALCKIFPQMSRCLRRSDCAMYVVTFSKTCQDFTSYNDCKHLQTSYNQYFPGIFVKILESTSTFVILSSNLEADSIFGRTFV